MVNLLSSIWKMKWEYNNSSLIIVIMKISFDTFKNYEIKIYKEFTNKLILINKIPHLLFYINQCTPTKENILYKIIEHIIKAI